MKRKLILGIETSCDETSLALIEASGGLRTPRFRVLKNLVSSQVKIHAPFGGVVPNLAKREHIKNLPVLYRKIFSKEQRAKSGNDYSLLAARHLPAIDIIAVTVGPGLEPALWTGIVFAQSLTAELRGPDADKRGKKSTPLLIGVNHLEGHLYSFLLPPQKKTAITNCPASAPPSPKLLRRPSKALAGRQLPIAKLFPAISLIVSGGHTILLLVKDLAHWKKLGETRDDAVGEAFDKVARIMGLPYPGGPEIERLAQSSKLKACPSGRRAQSYIPFPRPMLNQKNYDFSFSGLKTSVLYYVKEHGSRIHADKARTNADARRRTSALYPRTSAARADIAASFQTAAIEVLVQKTVRAAKEFNARAVMLSGGVAANKALRMALAREAKKIGCAFIAPETEYNTDNAAMIAAAGYMALLRSSSAKSSGRTQQGYGRASPKAMPAARGQAHLRKKKYKLEAQGNLTL